MAANVRTRKNQGGTDRSPRRPREAVGLGALEAAQHNLRECLPATFVGKPKRKLKCCSPATYMRRVATERCVPRRATNRSSTNSWRGTGEGSPPPDRKSGTDSALTRKPVTCWQPRSSPAGDVLKPLPNVRRNHRRHGQCPAWSGPEPLHLRSRKHISVNIPAARHVRQKHMHVPLGKEKENPAHKRQVGERTRARRQNRHHRHVGRVQENLCDMTFLAPAMDGDRHGNNSRTVT